MDVSNTRELISHRDKQHENDEGHAHDGRFSLLNAMTHISRIHHHHLRGWLLSTRQPYNTRLGKKDTFSPKKSSLSLMIVIVERNTSNQLIFRIGISRMCKTDHVRY